MNDDKIDAPDVAAAFTERVWEPSEKEPDKPPAPELNLEPPRLELTPTGTVSQKLRRMERTARAVEPARKKTLKERAAERGERMGLRQEFQQAKLKGLAARRFERAAQERDERGR